MDVINKFIPDELVMVFLPQIVSTEQGSPQTRLNKAAGGTSETG